jgi:nicotinate-nucleotide adenylyltransferase
MHKIGIYSGSFGPIHNGHVAFANEAAKACGLSKVFFLVEPRPRRKQGVKALEHRERMVRLALRGEKRLGCLLINHARFTVLQTLPALQARFKGDQIYFLMGDDTLHHFTDEQWPHIDEFVRAMRLVIGIRNRSEEEVTNQVKLIEASRGVKINYSIFHSDFAAATSTQVRLELRHGQRPAELNAQVYDYIKRHGLYTSAATS